MTRQSELEQDRWLDQLDDDRLSDVLKEVGRLKPDARRAAVAKPLELLQRAGLPAPPAGITVKLARHRLSDFRDRPRIPNLTRLLDIPRIKIFCFTICRWRVVNIGGLEVRFRRDCRLVCMRV